MGWTMRRRWPRLALLLALVCSTAAAEPLHVSGELAPLRAVLVHEPGKALGRVTSANAKRMLFSSPVDDWGRARAQHQGFQARLAERGVRVERVGALLGELLEHPEHRSAIIDEVVAARPQIDARRRGELARFLRDQPSELLASYLTEGLSREELSALSPSRQWKSLPELALPAHANLVFTRDTSKVVGDGVTVTRMAAPLRREEARLVRALYERHPRFAGARPLVDHARTGFDAIEGGDLLVIDPHTLLVGVGERTSPKAVLAYARELFAAGTTRAVLMTRLPDRESMFHLDTIMNRVTDDAFLIHPIVHQLRNTIVLTPDGRGGVQARRSQEPVLDAVARVTGRSRSFRTIAPEDEQTADREQVLDGANVLPIGNGVVVAYGHNPASNAALERAGVEVLRFDGDQLVRGRGGPHCMSRPLVAR